MAWFEYGIPRKRSLRKNVCLRTSALPENILKIAKKYMRPKEDLTMVKIVEIQKDNKVLLEFWSRKIGKDPMNRFTVFYLSIEESPNWICESDIGRGYKE